MKIVVWGINYAPEVTGIGPFNTSLCEYLHGAGHAVEMVTTFSYYPAWKKQREDECRFWRTDLINGVLVHRCWHYVPEKVTRLKRILHEATFILTSLPRVLSRNRADVIVAVSPPLLLGVAVWIASVLLGARSVFHVQDLQPDAALGLGMLKPGLFTRFLYGIEAFSYRMAWRVSGISKGMLDVFVRKGMPEEKLIYFPNGARFSGALERGAFRARYGFGENDFLAIYSGNMGMKQGLEILLQAASKIVKDRIKIVICGDGAQRNEIVRQADQLENVTILPLLSEEDYRAMLADCDVALITQVANSGQAFFPSKLLNPLAASRAVVSVADNTSELARAVAESGCGVNILPGNPDELADALMHLAANPEQLGLFGKAGREWVEQFEMSRVLGAFEKQITAS